MVTGVCGSPATSNVLTANSIFTKPKEFLLEENTNIDLSISTNVLCPKLKIKILDIECHALLDSGSEVSCISDTFFNSLLSMSDDIVTLPVVGVTILGATNRRSKRVTKQVYLTVHSGVLSWNVVFLVVLELICDVILGIDWLTENAVNINFSTKIVSINGQLVDKNCLSCDVMHSENFTAIDCDDRLQSYESLGIAVSCTSNTAIEEDKGIVKIDEIKTLVEEQPGLNSDQKSKLLELLLKYQHLFSDRPGLVTNYQHRIKIEEGDYFFEKNYPVPFAYREAVEQQLNKMLRHGIIEEATSPYINPLVVVIKKNKTVRLCLDARQLNKMLVPEHESPDPPESILQSFSNFNWLSTIDLVSSYWQVPLSVESRKYVAFKYNQRVYQFKVLPFGLSTSVAAFTRCTSSVLGNDLGGFLKPYVDDFLMFSKTFEEHLRHIDTVFDRLSKRNMTVSLNKSVFCRDQVSFLGHILTSNGLSPDPHKLLVIQDWPIPKNVKHLKAFLGLCSYYRRFSNVYAQSTCILQTLLKKDTTWKWSEECNSAFQYIKTLFISTVHLRFPDYTKPFFLQCDASDKGLGAQLFQLDSDGNLQVISMASRVLHGGEVNFTISEKELLAIVWSLMKFRIFVLGTDLTIITDHKALTFLLHCKLLSGRLTRWVLLLQEFKFKLIHCSGKQNTVADILSRFCVQTNGTINESYSSKDVIIAKLNVGINYELRKQFKQLPKLQKVDLKLGPIWFDVSNNVGDHQNYNMFNEILFFRMKDKPGIWKLCVPQTLISTVIVSIHEEIGHFGAKKCLMVLLENFHFGNMARLTRKLIACCDLCQRTKHSNKVSHGVYQPIIPYNIGQLVATDIYGPLPTGSGGVRYVLVFIDVFSKLVSLYTLKKQTASAVSKKVSIYFDTVQTPVAVLSDHGTQYTSREWNETLEARGVRAYMSSIRHPQSNPAERVMRELGRIFRAYCSIKHSSWVKWVPQLEEWLNSTYHEGTGFSPYELHFGQKFIPQIVKNVQFPTDEDAQLTRDAKIVLARERLKYNGQNRKNRHEARFNNKTIFQVGDKVLLKSLHLSDLLKKETKKFFHIFEGPYVVAAVAGENAYELVTITGSLKGVFNVVNLKLYKECSQT